MKNIIIIIQIIISIALISAILLQARGTGLGAAWGGGGESYRSKRGVEKILFYLTIILAVLFFITSFVSSVI
ncbi:preprotein translocase subunit SecG [Candidatus Shapirobacteria bacterium CG08_land_8_20_14_0_20_39_18]|uniref:Protein-export membrane protein SecG n=1 Tax=Candidatus Shapirobacteria bacterium CG08_land_8_20_14_0_20_39_18 TaxID=1974883 RepID=A0A2M6XCZ8_9BACT|nr:MAG: preprotein translocase subunit SecG [Candidatus Shapirobacteria bacterium CG08_land_8_20_14_0_20_39_18]